jgi:hypothetical protein
MVTVAGIAEKEGRWKKFRVIEDTATEAIVKKEKEIHTEESRDGTQRQHDNAIKTFTCIVA